MVGNEHAGQRLLLEGRLAVLLLLQRRLVLVLRLLVLLVPLLRRERLVLLWLRRRMGLLRLQLLLRTVRRLLFVHFHGLNRLRLHGLRLHRLWLHGLCHQQLRGAPRCRIHRAGELAWVCALRHPPRTSPVVEGLYRVPNPHQKFTLIPYNLAACRGKRRNR